MDDWQSVPLGQASRLLNHGPTVLVTSVAGGKRNIMAAAWSMPVEFEPPRIAVVIDKKTYTKELVGRSGVFGICIPGTVLINLSYAVGSVSGREVDKFGRFGFDARSGPVLGVPILQAGCSAWMECRLIPEARTEEAYDTCFAEVVSAAANSRIFAGGRWDPRDDNRDLHTIHHLGAGVFVQGTDAVRARPLVQGPA